MGCLAQNRRWTDPADSCRADLLLWCAWQTLPICFLAWLTPPPAEMAAKAADLHNTLHAGGMGVDAPQVRVKGWQQRGPGRLDTSAVAGSSILVPGSLSPLRSRLMIEASDRTLPMPALLGCRTTNPPAAQRPLLPPARGPLLLRRPAVGRRARRGARCWALSSRRRATATAGQQCNRAGCEGSL